MVKRLLCMLLLLCVCFGLVLPSLGTTAQAAYTTEEAPSATAEEVLALFRARSEGVHPRILANEDDFLRIRRNIDTDPYLKTVYAKVYSYCVEQLTQPVSEYVLPDGVRLLNISKTASQRISWMAMLYRISGDYRFAERAIEEMMAVCAFSDWHPKHYLDVGQMAYGVGLGYDWLYYELTPAQRSTISKALHDYAVATSPGQWYKTLNSNWNAWCHGGVAIAAAAIFEDYPADCSDFFANAVTDIQKSLAVFAPMGSYPEGPGYSQIGTLFSALLFETMTTVLGTDFGLSDMEGFRDSGNYLRAMTGYVNSFNYGDGSQNILDGAVFHWYAKRYQMPELSAYQKTVQTFSHDEHLELLWYDPAQMAEFEEGEKQLDFLMYSDEGQSIALFRSFEEDAYQIYAAIKSGYNSTSHADMDIGTFVMEAMGVRWFTELGSDNYNLPGYGTYNANTGYAENIGRWKYYRKRAEGQNTLVINPSDLGGQASNARCQITAYESGYDGGHAVVDMLDAYDSYGVTNIRRGLSLFDNRSRVLLQDEFTCKSASEVYWFAHTMAQISLSADGKTAWLTQDGKTLKAELASPSGAVFTTMDAVRLNGQLHADEYSRADYRKLVIHLKNVTTTKISVVFTPILTEGDKTKTAPNLTLDTMGNLTADYAPGTTLTEKNGVYEIRNAEQFFTFANMVRNGNSFSGKTVKLLSDLDLKSRSVAPIGGAGSKSAFKGTFDGGNHVIRNLCIFRPGQTAVALFGEVGGATIRNLGIENGIVFGGQKSGGLTGLCNNSVIENCFNRATVIGNGAHIGGLAGQMGGNGAIRNSYNHGTVRNSASISGGIVGYIAGASTIELTNCYSVGKLSASNSRCGMIGFYNTKDLTLAPTKITVNNCHSTTPLKCAEMVALTGVESFTDSATVTKAQLTGRAVKLGAKFMDDCEQVNGGYPVFSWQCKTTLPEDLAISTEAELRLLSYLVNSGKETFAGKTVTLQNDIDLGSRQWIPIGGNTDNDSTGKVFRGIFDGKGYGVRNVQITLSNNYIGFFGSVSGTIRNFGILSGRIIGNDKVGGIAGYMTGTMSSCYSRANVTANNFAGGLIGMSGKSTVTDSYHTGCLTVKYMTGGLIGYFNSGSGGSLISNSYNGGSVTGREPGQLVGNINSAVTNIALRNCYGLNSTFVHTAAGYETTDCSALTQAQLKAHASTLGKAFCQDSLRPQNKGYPVLNVSMYHISATPTLPVDSSGVYHISTVEDLVALAYLVNVEQQSFAGKNIHLDADLDLQYRPWVPIGGNFTSDTATNSGFRGSFLGQGHRLHHLCIPSGNWYSGVFGLVDSGRIENLGVESGMVFGGQKTAALVGCLKKSTVRGCYNKAHVNGTTIVGGIVGMANLSGNTIENTYNKGNISASQTTGGIVGYFASGTVNTAIRNCYNTGTAEGGIVGTVNASASVTMTGAYTLNTVPVVHTPSSMTVTSCGQLTAAQIRAHAGTLGSAFGEDLRVQNRMDPVLAWENDNASATLPQENGKYIISTADQLRLLSYLVRKGNTFTGKEILLAADIDLENTPFLPIGGVDETKTHSFKGTFDGRGYVIRGLYCEEMENGYAGLFGYVNGATIRNTGVESGVVIGKEKTAGLIGTMDHNGKLLQCYNQATVYGNSISGGLIGMAGNKAVVENCYNTGWVSAKYEGSSTAGLIGYISGGGHNGTLKNCYNVGNYYGFIGHVNPSATNNVVSNSYTTGAVKFYKTPSAIVTQNSALLSAHVLKSYASVLGDAFDTDTKGQNHGYPVLSWQSGKLCFHDYDTGAVTKAPTLTAKGTKVYTCLRDPSHTYSEELEPLHKALFFDFDNGSVAQSRYNNYVYSFRNFDTADAWRGRTTGLVDGSHTLDTDKGTISVRPGVTGYSSIYADSVNIDLNYDPDNAEYFQIRFKATGLTGTAGKASVHFYYKTDNTYLAANAVSFHPDYLNGDRYYIATGKIQDAVRALEEVNRVVIHLSGFTAPTDLNAVVTFDYAYVGPYEGLPNRGDLYFGFGNTDGDRIRYNTRAYGYTQFDDPKGKNWFFKTDRVSDILIDPSVGTMTIRSNPALGADAWPDVYADTNLGSTGTTYPLRFHPGETEYFQIRFKMKNFRTGDQLITNADGSVTAKTIAPYLNLRYFTDHNGTSLGATDSYSAHASYIDADTYMVVTMPLLPAFQNTEEIHKLRVYFGGIESISASKVGELTVDYIYVGKLTDLPTPVYTVTFKDAAGKTLATQQVHRGESATYTGQTPTKTSDGANHYTFKGWDKALTNITADTTFHPVFTATAHSYTYTKSDETDHKATCSCGYSKTESHSYAYTILDAQSHTVSCENCELWETEPHSYENGSCICGALEVKEPVEDASLKLNHSLNLASDISVNLVVPKTLLEGFDMATVYVESTLETYAGNEKTGTQTIRLEPVDKGYFYYFTLDGLTAVQMNDKIASVLYGTKNGQPYYSPVDEYSIATYAYTQLNKTGIAESLKTLCADLLRYGSKAQSFKAYRTDSLADNAMTEEYRAYLSDIEAVTFGNTNRVLNDLTNVPITWAGKSLNLESKVALKFVFNMGSYTGNLSDLSLRISYKDAYGNGKTVLITEAEPYGQGTGAYVFTLDTLLAAELRTVVFAQIYAGDTPVSCTLQYSPDTYGNNKTGTLLDLCKALFAYSDSAKAYFT